MVTDDPNRERNGKRGQGFSVFGPYVTPFEVLAAI
jgi:hypothetical protein